MLTDEAKEFLIKKGSNTDFGARPLRRAIENFVEDPLSEELLKGEFQGKDTIMVDVKEVGGKKQLIFDGVVGEARRSRRRRGARHAGDAVNAGHELSVIATNQTVARITHPGGGFFVGYTAASLLAHHPLQSTAMIPAGQARRLPGVLDICVFALGLTTLAMVLGVSAVLATDFGETLTRNTIRLSLTWYAAALVLMMRLAPLDWAAATQLGQIARWCWTWGMLCFLVHLAMAFHYYHHWSHSEAFECTRQQAGSGEGIYASYLFTWLWFADAAWWWLGPAQVCIPLPVDRRTVARLHAVHGVQRHGRIRDRLDSLGGRGVVSGATIRLASFARPATISPSISTASMSIQPL